MARKHPGSRWTFILAVCALAAGFVFLIAESRRHRSTSPIGANKQQWAVRAEEEITNLEINSVVQHGDIYEIIGSAEPGSSVMVNGQYAPMLFENSTFRYFVGPLPNGVTVLTITVQNESGGVNTKQLALTVP